MINTIEEFVQDAHTTATGRGFHDNPVELGTLLALIHTEVTEALEAQTPDHIAEEFGDIVIRIFDLCGEYNVPLNAVFKKRLGLNHFSQSILKSQENVASTREEACLKIHTLLTVVMEEYRLDIPNDIKYQTIANKLFDICYFIFNFCNTQGYQINNAIRKKMMSNKNRPFKHNKIV